MSEKINEKAIDILDLIVSNQKNVLEEIQAQSLENMPIHDARTIFKENNPLGLLVKENIRKVFNTFGKSELAPIRQLFIAMHNREKLNTSPFHQTDKKGNKYYWIKQHGKFGMTEYKLPHFEGLDELIAAYLFGLFRFDIDFTELYHESIK